MERHAELVYAESLFEKVRPSVYRLGLLPFVFPDMFLVLVLVLFLGYGFVLGRQVSRLNPRRLRDSKRGGGCGVLDAAASEGGGEGRGEPKRSLLLRIGIKNLAKDLDDRCHK